MKILIGYDGSNCADAALDDLKQAGLPREAEAVVLSVAEAWLPPPPPSSYDIVERSLHHTGSATNSAGGDWRAQVTQAAREMALETSKRLTQNFKALEVRAEARSGSPASEIIGKADEWLPDLIVVGSHGRSAISRFVLGSVSQRVLTEARCSVRVARGRVEEMVSPARIIIGIDGSQGAGAAVFAVAERNWPDGTEILAIAVGDPIRATSVGRLIPPVGDVVEEYNEEERAWAVGIVAACAQRLTRGGLTVKTSVKSGDPRRVLCAEAALWGADCIFLGARGLGLLDRFLLGSVSSAVAARAHCSVEVVRGPADVKNGAARP
jgi:nucleotide-binding universal stress UspA family protein